MNDKPRNIIGLRRGLSVLKALAEDPEGRTFGDLRRILGGLPPATVSRVLKILVDERWVQKREDRYCVGDAFGQVARALTGNVATREIVQPIVSALAEQTHESAAYFEMRGDAIMLLAKAEQEDSFHYIRVFGTHQLFSVHAFSHVCIAYLGPAEARRLYALRKEPRPVPKSEFFGRLAAIRTDDHTVDLHGGGPGTLNCIVAPVFLDEERRRVGSIGITTLVEPAPEQIERFTDLVCEAGRTATGRIAAMRGYRPPPERAEKAGAPKHMPRPRASQRKKASKG